MTAIDRTAYPRLSTRLTREELDTRYNLTETDLAFIRANARGDAGRLLLATLLKTRRDLGCFPAPDSVHPGTVAHLAAQLWERYAAGVGGRDTPHQIAVSLPRRGALPPFRYAIWRCGRTTDHRHHPRGGRDHE